MKQSTKPEEPGMGDDGFWSALKAFKKEKFDADRKRFLAAAESTDDGGWTKHTEFHWSRVVNGHRLDYWPSRKKFQYRGKVMRGNVNRIIKGAVNGQD